MPLLSSLLSALVVWFAIWLLTKREGSVSLKPVLVICVVACFATFVSLRVLGSWGIGLVWVGLMFALIQWCYLSVAKAILVALVWLLAQVGFGWFVSPIF